MPILGKLYYTTISLHSNQNGQSIYAKLVTLDQIHWPFHQQKNNRKQKYDIGQRISISSKCDVGPSRRSCTKPQNLTIMLYIHIIVVLSFDRIKIEFVRRNIRVPIIIVYIQQLTHSCTLIVIENENNLGLITMDFLWLHL